MSLISLNGNFAVMSSYVLDTRSFVVINETIYVLVAFKESKVNYVCEKCDLFEQCCNATETLVYLALCVQDKKDCRWFFKDLLKLETEDKRKFIKDLREIAADVESYYL